MSGSDGIISFDLKHGHGSVLDIAAMFPLTSLHAIDQGEGKRVLDAILPQRKEYDLSVKMRVSLSRFRTLATLDLALQEIRDATPVEPGAYNTRRKMGIKVIEPIYIPYQSVDIRKYQKRSSTIRYPDLFARSLPYKIMARRVVKNTRKFIYKKRYPIGITIGATLAISLPLLYFVKIQVENGYSELLSLTQIKSSLELQEHSLKARGYFERARVVFFPFSWLPIEKVNIAHQALLGGLAVSRAIDTIARTLPTDPSILAAIPKSRDITPSYRGSAKDIYTASILGIESPTTWIKNNKETLESVIHYLQEASNVYLSQGSDPQYTKIFSNVGNVLSTVSTSLDWYISHQDNILSILGDEAPKRYIVFNQNRDEIRANGGFPGSIITFTLYKGNILDYRKDDVYYFDWNLYPYKELPPPGIALLTDNYGLRDVNYYPDFRKTLEKANIFVERSGDSTLTTGIAIHQGLIEDILEKVGAVTVSGVTIPFTSDNFSVHMSTLVEAKFGRQTHSKDVLFSFIDAFVKKIQTTNSHMAVIDSIRDYWNSGEILIASRDERDDAFFSQFRKRLPWECDSLEDETCHRNWAYPVFTSVSGNKSDRYIERSYKSRTTKIFGCKYENVVTITDTHTFKKKDSDAIDSYLDEVGITDVEERAKYKLIQGSGRNKAFIRLYVPLGSELATEGGHDIDVETNDNSMIFSFSLDTPSGGSASKTIRYATNIPNCENFDSTLSWYKQPGLRKVEIK